MAVKLRLARFGKKKTPFYRIVASEKGSRRDGRFIEVVGTYNPKLDPPAITLKEEKVKKWLTQGATPTKVVGNIINKKMSGLIEERETHQREKIQQARRQRKERSKARPAKSK